MAAIFNWKTASLLCLISRHLCPSVVGLLVAFCCIHLITVSFFVVFACWCLFISELEAGVVRAGPKGAGPQWASVALHLPCAAPGPTQRLRHAPQNLHTPQEVRVFLTFPPPTHSAWLILTSTSSIRFVLLVFLLVLVC